MPRLAWLKFFTNDWLGDELLQSCSPAARGLWINMLCLMHKAEPRGHLMLNSSPMTPRQLAVLAHVTEDEVLTLLAELERMHVFSRTEKNTIVSRRMERDDKKSKACSDAGKRGGNPLLGCTTLKGEDKGRLKATLKPSLTSNLWYLDSKSGDSGRGSVRGKPAVIETIYQAYPLKVKKQDAIKRIGEAVVAIHKRGESDPSQWLYGRVCLFAESLVGKGDYCPHPTSWFYQGRYDDDEAEWNRADADAPLLTPAQKFIEDKYGDNP